MANKQEFIRRARVPLGFLLGALCLILATPKLWSIASGALLALFGLAWRAWASGHLRKNEKLAITGPYAYTRNPLYFGSLFLGAGFALATARLELVAIFVLFYLLVYSSVMRSEADYMQQTFPNQYPNYAENVPLFLPRLTAWKEGSKADFDLSLYLRYREYRALLGTVAALGVLIAKTYWLGGIYK
ncbi:MAG: isoprenylcysteine carboxylmethyltransferase family protein [Acidobacteria bacterium]|nr:isoprenylcysteine carboxylmethyltransferase family protein [Acidobacteriota bacterium]